ncbi:unnamed protein product, partial [Durusdinium trenchii]
GAEPDMEMHLLAALGDKDLKYMPRDNASPKDLLKMLHLKDEWLHKRYGVVKQAAQSFLDTRVTLLAYPEKFGPGTALETCDEIKKESEQWLKKLNCKSM